MGLEAHEIRGTLCRTNKVTAGCCFLGHFCWKYAKQRDTDLTIIRIFCLSLPTPRKRWIEFEAVQMLDVVLLAIFVVRTFERNLIKKLDNEHNFNLWVAKAEETFWIKFSSLHKWILFFRPGSFGTVVYCSSSHPHLILRILGILWRTFSRMRDSLRSQRSIERHDS